MRILRRGGIQAATGLSMSTIYRLMKRKGEGFPLPIKLSSQAVGWREDDVAHWISSRERKEIQ